MTQCKTDTQGEPTGRGRGTGKPPFSSPNRIKSEGIKEGDLFGGDSETVHFAVPRPLSEDDDPAALARFLADNPAMTVRDWKGKGFHEFAPFDKYYVGATELPWDKLDRDEVRRLATSEKARFLTRGQRMAAARDPGLIWDERSRSYRLRDEATPTPPLATEDRGHEKPMDGYRDTGGSQNKKRKHGISGRNSLWRAISRTRARARS